MGLQLLPRYSGWKKPSFTIEGLLITSHKYFFQEMQQRRPCHWARTSVSDFQGGEFS